MNLKVVTHAQSVDKLFRHKLPPRSTRLCCKMSAPLQPPAVGAPAPRIRMSRAEVPGTASSRPPLEGTTFPPLSMAEVPLGSFMTLACQKCGYHNPFHSTASWRRGACPCGRLPSWRSAWQPDQECPRKRSSSSLSPQPAHWTRMTAAAAAAAPVPAAAASRRRTTTRASPRQSRLHQWLQQRSPAPGAASAPPRNILRRRSSTAVRSKITAWALGVAPAAADRPDAQSLSRLQLRRRG
jgi:hypothetical protein